MMIESGTSQCPRLYNVILAGPQHREIGTPISTGNGSWGRGPTQRNWNPNFNRQWKLAGPQHREIGTPISTGNGSWGRGPTQKLTESQISIMCELG
ncbi:hypothetical protein BMF16_03935 [Staphylococcus aureus]|nr:hypothetical protein DLJ56_05815 [Staphylococcus aureus]ONH07476.1 hypothetical protein BMF16_03935 [Staphylococcus aureus]ONH18486.1 hypothetical protein BMF19_05035 [Staphylococcus aureus]ONH20258.1 hypothetical protein BMF23_03905 [Staphylococcus aureus]